MCHFNNQFLREEEFFEVQVSLLPSFNLIVGKVEEVLVGHSLIQCLSLEIHENRFDKQSYHYKQVVSTYYWDLEQAGQEVEVSLVGQCYEVCQVFKEEELRLLVDPQDTFNLGKNYSIDDVDYGMDGKEG